MGSFVDYELKMPDLSAATEEVSITEWYVGEGETVQRGQPILAVETDKAQMDVESVVSGRLKRIVAGDDETVAARQVIAIIEVNEAPGATPKKPEGDSQSAGTTAPTADTASAPRTPKAGPAGRSGMFERNRRRRGEQ